MGGGGHQGSSFWECPEVPRGPGGVPPRTRAKLPPGEDDKWVILMLRPADESLIISCPHHHSRIVCSVEDASRQ